MTTTSSSKRNLKEYFRLLLSGFCMGAADIVPGVSGGTVAFLLGIYEELILSIRNILSKDFFTPLAQFKLKKAFAHIHAPFLIAVGSGIILAVLSLSHLLESALEQYPHMVWSVFFGLIAASVLVVSSRVTQWHAKLWVLFAVGAMVAYGIVGLTPSETPEAPWFIFLSGAIVICAMILPGISGSFLLVLLGKYEFILQAVNNRDLVSIVLFCAGAGIGILLFAQVLSRLFQKYHDQTIVILAGMMLGSLRKIWPWNEANVQVGEASSLVMITCIALGFIAVLLLEKRIKSSN